MQIILAFVISGFIVAGLQAQPKYPAIREELLKMDKSDQDARLKCTSGPAEGEAKCLSEITKSIDEPNTKRLEEIFEEIGFPNTAKVGKKGLSAFMLVLQHAPTDDLRVMSLKPITEAFRNKEIPPLDYANFVDRLRLHQGKKQLYGSSFDFKDGKLVMSATEDPKDLAKRRAKIGLPTLADLIKELADMYHMEVVVPED
ncbi:MAG TPA: DUF6624 domain-containing protein [Pyrinomonadaceae bacterium]|nr:DUF6624 domain-containing protein [Pyrinomonadaceae bacterium]